MMPMKTVIRRNLTTKKNYGERLLCWCMLMVMPVFAIGQQSIENAYYKVQPAIDFKKSPGFIVTHKVSNLQRRVTPALNLVYSNTTPEMTSASMDGQPGVVAWNKNGLTVPDINALGNTPLVARAYKISGNQLVFSFKDPMAAHVSLTIKFIQGQEAPVFEMEMTARKAGHFSLGFSGMPKVDSAAIDFVYQPLTWSWKRFPSRFALTEEAYANTAAVFTNHNGYTEGLAVLLSDIPYRYARSAQWNNAGKKSNAFWSVFPEDGPKGNSLFGMAVRNPEGKAQPTIYAPLPGTERAALKAGEKFHIGLVYVLHPGDWQAGTTHLLSTVFNYRSERENARTSLNQTFENMLNFAMNDVYSGWNAELKASDYQFDVPGTVKNVSALHALSLAMVTGNEEILRRRAIPTIEYVMSREKFLFSTSDSAHQSQVPSHLLNGPCVDIGELSALHEMTNGYTPAFALEANRLFGKSRQLNMNTQTGGGSWQDYLARYRLHRNNEDLRKAVDGAKDYLRQVYHNYSHTFFDSPGLRDRGAGFTTDYGLRIYDLFELFQETKDSLYLKAAVTGAKQLLLWTRSNPAPPETNITVNKGGKVEGIFPGRRVSALEGAPFVPMDVTSYVPEQTVPAWETSLNGLIPEAPNTYAFGPVMLAHHAAWLLRLAHCSGDTLLRNAAYNAIVGRYSNFPGYYFTSLHTDVYQRQDYPMHPFADVKYNAIFYNHVWPHLALLMDFLVSDFYYRSKGQIDFPGTYAPGYAFLTSQVYGAKKGTVMGNPNVQLWMPSHAIRSDGIAFNYIMGYNETDLFLAFANTSRKAVTENISLNREVIPWDMDQEYTILLHDMEGKAAEEKIKNGKLSLTIPAGGFRCIQVKGMSPAKKYATPPVQGAISKNRFLRYHALTDTTATATAMVIQTNARTAVCYLYANKTEKDWKACTFRYRINGEQTWSSVTDENYPFEFDLPLNNVNDAVDFEIIATQHDGSELRFPVKTINH